MRGDFGVTLDASARAEARIPAAHRLVQAARRVQQPAVARRSGGRRRGGLRRQSRRGGRLCGAAARPQGDDLRAGRVRAGEDRAHQELRRRHARRRRALCRRARRVRKHSSRQSGALSVHAYDAAETIAGQGSVGLEWEEDAPELDTVLVAVGGGGLIAGIAAWYGRRVKVVGVEPEGSRCLHASLEAGRPVDVTVESIAADSLGARNTGQLCLRHRARERGSRRAGAGRRDRRGAAAAVGPAAHRRRAGRRGCARRADRGRYEPRAGREGRRAAVRRQCRPRQAGQPYELSGPPGRRLPRFPRRAACRWSRAAIASSPSAASRPRSW